MKLLTWMHRKFRQGSTETLKEYSLGQPFLDDPHLYQKQNPTNGTLRQVHRDGQARKSFASLEATRLADLEEKATDGFSEFFEGFLAIGTLGTEAGITEPGTPTFQVSFEKLAEGETTVTETELRLINDELERVLAAEAKDDCWTDSSGRNSHVSNGRISHASTITLSGKPLEIPERTSTGSLTCPLQEYLLGSAVEVVPEKVAAPRKENRTSLGELFEKHKEEEVNEAKHKRGDKEGERNATTLLKKILKKKILHATSRSSSGTTKGTGEPTSAETKLCKILQKFHRKVHPERLTSSEKTDKGHKIGIKDVIPCHVGYDKERPKCPANIAAFSQRAFQDGHLQDSKSHSNPSQSMEGDSDSNGNRECWIKTDADYLVLEL